MLLEKNGISSPIRDALCVYNEFKKTFKFCDKQNKVNEKRPSIDLNKFEKDSFESWEEVFISKSVVEKK